ncbi:hypothetical protein M430DRAFT_155231 [Amorphotheca resinae ATCC 22711]|jgi:esterase/lipase|uniref:WKF domain-containing protein n=1 Tax=Amorphotheca resinae ATCC 22711 TaxID=857342 RepID=A0A2T3BDW6_AMORE|nr:hypothetical protein M430DRAFT_155231 [Amorphotheca resinae ATCC 22711]PSS27528.1 hypothetical protein M430DRAFT_155231 [Amorphotheca resinae ATCC 22711]
MPSATSTSNTASGTPITKRKNESEDTLPAKKVKKRKHTEPSAEPITPKLTRKKSVTFTPETKVEDGDSIKQLFNAWVTEQKSRDPTFQFSTSGQAFATPEPPKVEEQFNTEIDEKERRVKRVKKPKAETAETKDTPKKKSKQSKIVKPTATPPRPFLAYLRQYHEDRANWKFNKNHQNHLLKHIFDLNIIPSDHIHLVYAYIRGLQGGVRTRLRDTALSIKVKDQEEGAAGFPDMDSRGSRNTETPEEKKERQQKDQEKRQQEYENCCKEYIATMTQIDASSKMGYEEGLLLGLSDYAMKERVAKRTRAEQILAELGAGASPAEAEARATPSTSGLTYPEEVAGDNDSQKRLRMNDGSTQKVARRRKQRTLTEVSDTSSSDESSSSDDSSSDSDDSESDTDAKRPEDTSSSSSSSSSESESSSEDEQEETSSEEESDESDDSGSQ